MKTFGDFRSQFLSQLAERYTQGESEKLFYIFAEEITGKAKMQLRPHLQDMPDEKIKWYFETVLRDLQRGKPYQQILRKAEFFGYTFEVDEHVLIPRPETEELIELALEKLKTQTEKKLRILEVGTGSGIISILLKMKFPNAEITAVDLSGAALKMAKKNAVRHGTTILFVEADYLSMRTDKVFDVIISNPPYIGSDEEIDRSVKDFEPEMALFAPAENPVIFYEKIAADCAEFLTKDGWVFLEINQRLGAETKALFTKVLSEVHVLKDISGNDRFVAGRK